MAAGLAVQAWTASPFPLPPFHPGDARRILTALIAAGPEAVAFADYRRVAEVGRGPQGDLFGIERLRYSSLMSVMAILTDEFLRELPDDPRVAFGLVLRRAEAYLADAERAADETHGNGWHDYVTAQHTAMNTIIAVAKHYDIQPFATMIIPRRKGFDSETFDEFKVDLDHYTA